MSKSISLRIFLILSLFFLIGCNATSSLNNTNNNTFTGSGVITGSLYTGSINTSSIKTSSTGSIKVASTSTPLEDHTVVAISKDTGAIYFSDPTTATGSYEITGLPENQTFYMEILDDNNKAVAPIVFGTSSDDLIMAVEPGTNIGKIALDTSKDTAVPETNIAQDKLDNTALADTKTGETLVPKGAGNLGKGSDAKLSGGSTYDDDKIDGDKDGRSNFFDADNDGDGITDEFDGGFQNDLSQSSVYSWCFMNLKVDSMDNATFKQDYSEFNLAIGMGVLNSPQSNSIQKLAGKTIQSIKAIPTKSATWISKAYVTQGFNHQPSDPLWSASGYEISSGGLHGYEVFLTGLVPVTDVNAGDIIVFEVTFTDNTKEEVSKMINTVFTDIPRLTAYSTDGTNWTDVSPQPNINTLPALSSTHVYLRWLRPKDENGNDIIGGRYTWEYNSTQGGAREVEVIASDSGTGAYLEANKDFSGISDADLTQNPFMIGICIRSMANDNSAQNIHFQDIQ